MNDGGCEQDVKAAIRTSQTEEPAVQISIHIINNRIVIIGNEDVGRNTTVISASVHLT